VVCTFYPIFFIFPQIISHLNFLGGISVACTHKLFVVPPQTNPVTPTTIPYFRPCVACTLYPAGVGEALHWADGRLADARAGGPLGGASPPPPHHRHHHRPTGRRRGADASPGRRRVGGPAPPAGPPWRPPLRPRSTDQTLANRLQSPIMGLKRTRGFPCDAPPMMIHRHQAGLRPAGIILLFVAPLVGGQKSPTGGCWRLESPSRPVIQRFLEVFMCLCSVTYVHPWVCLVVF